MGEREALLAGVLDEPESDARRLIYADWLEEYGGAGDRERATFIRHQLRNPDDVRNVVSGRGCQACPAWAYCFSFRRGFVESVRAPLAALVEHLPGVMACHPVTRAEVTDREPIAWGDLYVTWREQPHAALLGIFEGHIPSEVFAQMVRIRDAHRAALVARDLVFSAVTTDARDCLSAALLTLARRPGGTPDPLEPAPAC